MATVIAEHLGGTITRISQGFFNCYVVHDAGGGTPLVVDPGTPSNGTSAANLLRLAHGPACKANVVCTHGHLDHVAGVPQVCATAADGYHLPAPCEGYLAGTSSQAPPGPRQVVKILPVLASQPIPLSAYRALAPLLKTVGHQKTGMAMPMPPAGFLADGDDVPGSPGWTVLATPGHTEDSTCFYHAGSATLLSGDSVLVHEGQAWCNPEIGDAQASAGTEERLRTLPVEHLFPGHGLPISGTDLLRNARSFRDRPPPTSMSCRLARLLGAWSS